MRCLRVLCALTAVLPAFAQTQFQITTTSPLPGATLGTSYSAAFQASGGVTPYTWTLNTTPPPGLNFGSNGTLSGTPTQAGTYTISASVTDSSPRRHLTASGTFSLTVQAPPLTITSSSPLPGGTVAASYSYSLSASGGKPPYTWALAGGSLPAGLSLSAGGQISGTPTAAGNSSFTVKVTDSEVTDGPPVSAQAQLSLSVGSAKATPLTITSASPLPNGTATAKYSYTLTATGGTAPYLWTVIGGTLPSGIVSRLGMKLFKADGDTREQRPFVAVPVAPPGAVGSPALSFTTPTALPNGATGAAYSATFAATGAPPYGLSTTSTVGGLQLSSGGVLSGTPTTVGTYNFSVQVSDSPQAGVPQQTASKTFTLKIAQPLTVTTPSPINATLGTQLTVVLNAAGGTFPYIWQVPTGSQLPPGFTLDGTSGFLSGTPTTAGTFNFTVQLSDSAGNMTTNALQMIVTTGIAITAPTTTPTAAAGASFSLTFSVVGGVAPFTWSVSSGTLPPGLTLSTTTGVLSGTPAGSGNYPFTIKATDYNNNTATKPITLTINAPGQGALITTQSLAFTAIAGGNAPATQSFALATSGAAPLLFTIATDSGSTGSAVPPWLTVLLLQGSTPARVPVAIDQTGLAAGTFAARILVNTSDGHQTVVAVTLTVITAPPLLDVSPGYLRYGGPLSTLAATEEDLLVSNLGGGGPLAFTAMVIGSPSWLTITPASGVAGPNALATIRALVNATGLPTGARNAMITVTSAAGTVNIPLSLYVRADGPAIGTDLSGVQFEGRQGNGDANDEVVNVLNLGTGTVNWTAQILSGGSWLSIVGPASGQSTTAAASALTLQVNTSALVAQQYYALVSLTDPNATNSPQFFTVMLNVDSATAAVMPQPDPEGLLFVAKAGGAAPAAQMVNVFASSSTPQAFEASANTAGGGSWLSVNPPSGMTSTAATAQVSVTVNPANLKAGIYSGEVVFALSSTLVRSTNVTLVVQPATVTASAFEKRTTVAGCTPSKLAIAPTGLPNSFAQPAGWPTALAVRLADECGSAVLNGQVVTTFSNGDPALTMKLTDTTLGTYSATWAPSHVTGTVTMTAHASAPNLATASVDITGAVTPNQSPVLSTNGTLSFVNPVVGAPLAPGTVAQVNGVSLAASTAEPGVIPAPGSFNGTQVLVGGLAAPLLSLSSGQLAVQLPNELSAGHEYPVVVSANGGITLPDTITTGPVGPGLFVYPDNSAIAQHMDSSLVNADSPAQPNETVVVFLVGMGATDTPVASGNAAPSSPAANVLTTPVVMVGGQQAAVVFAELVPGGVGIYQMALTVPAGIGPGYLPLGISQNGVAANPATLPVQ